jgi:hypothetical protein
MMRPRSLPRFCIASVPAIETLPQLHGARWCDNDIYVAATPSGKAIRIICVTRKEGRALEQNATRVHVGQLAIDRIQYKTLNQLSPALAQRF